ncbi:MAG: efflux transporter outer membrane subunit [Rhodanobacter sp.]|nr:MAG: efflux transporter outer membrane subunit [Rhodanobacter sp.]TAM10347.1 MAG: efflux transporter outer membrane subunit [Rhodanobacter sp.]TAM34445.1 MAG: efflux transporter outer membrane subunit [Rhodanobacter sp.]
MTSPRLRIVAMPALALLVASCAFAPPKVAPPHLQPEAPLAGLPVPTGSHWPVADWWRAYADPQLDTLMSAALRQSPDLALAEARVTGAEQSVRLAAAQAGLRIDGSAQVSRQRMSEHGLMPPQLVGFSWYNQADLGVQFRYDFDWWGKHRARVDSARDQARAAAAQRSAAALAIQHAVADAYFGWLADEARLTLVTQALGTQQQLQKLAQLRVTRGVDLPDSALEANTRVAAAQQAQTALRSSAEIRKLALAALLGVAPSALPPLTPRALPMVNAQLPADASIDLAARRPDIAASRWQVEAALRQTDAARAQFFPDFSLTALAGLSSTNQGTPALFGGHGGGSLGNVFEPGSRVFGITPALHLPIFEGGQLKAAHGISRAQLDAAVAQYDAAVFHAAREAGSQALAAQQLATRRAQQQAQVAAGERLYANAQARLRQGVRDARESLASRAQLLQQQDQAVALHAQALTTDLALIQALGGGYRMPPVATPHPARSQKP